MSDVILPAQLVQPRIPLAVKLVYSLFMLILVPTYLISYGPTNFLWFCDVALIVTLIGIWTESPLLISTQAVAIVAPQMLWCADFVLFGLTGSSIAGLADYMFDPKITLFARGLSLFHGWLPFLLLYLVVRLGYDRRALKYQIALSWAVLIATYLLVPGPDGPAENVNKVLKPAEWAATWPSVVWLGFLCAAYPTLIYIPSHLGFSWAQRRGWLPQVERPALPSQAV